MVRLKNRCLNAAIFYDEKFVDCGRLFHAFISRWAKNRLRMLVQCDVYNLYGWPLVVDTGQYFKKSPKFKRTRPKTIL